MPPAEGAGEPCSYLSPKGPPLACEGPRQGQGVWEMGTGDPVLVPGQGWAPVGQRHAGLSGFRAR